MFSVIAGDKLPKNAADYFSRNLPLVTEISGKFAPEFEIQKERFRSKVDTRFGGCLPPDVTNISWRITLKYGLRNCKI